MNQIVNKLLLAEDRFMPELHLRQLGFTYSGPENKQENLKIYPNRRYKFIYKNELDKACFQDDMAYGKYKEHNQNTKR